MKTFLENKKIILLLFFISFLFLLCGVQGIPVTDPVESNYALPAKEMVLSNNWISPTIYGHYWFDKPIMIYWVTALSYKIFGFTDLASRLPSILAGSLSISLLVFYALRLYKNNQIAIFSGLFLMTSLQFWIVSHAIITDQLLLLFTIPTMLSAYIGLTENNIKHLIIAYIAAGLACLTKGPVGIVLPGLLLLTWCLFMRSKEFFKRCFPWQGILCFILVAMPWYGSMIYIHGTEFVNQFLGLHNIIRATSSEHPQDNHWYYYLVLLPLSLLPWTGLTFDRIFAHHRSSSNTPFYKFLLVWFGGTLLFYTLIATKYPTYTYIAIIPAILLAAEAIPPLLEHKPSLKINFLTTSLFFIFILTAGTFWLKNINWTPFYIIAACTILSMTYCFTKNFTKELLYSAITGIACLYLCIITIGLPPYLSTRSGILMASTFHNLPGDHMFFNSYSTSFTYYTGETAIRLVPTTKETTKEGRNPLWDNKYTMPSITDTELTMYRKDTPVYLYVSKNNKNSFNAWSLRSQFEEIYTFPTGSIFKWVNTNELLSRDA